MKAVLAIDPGRAGSAVLLALETASTRKGLVIRTVSWRASTSKGVRGYLVAGEWCRTIRKLMEVVWIYMNLDPAITIVAVSVEGIVLGKGKSPRSILVLAEETGAVVDAMRGLGFEPYRPSASVWRGAVLRIGRMNRKRAEKRAMDSRDQLFESGHGLTTIHETEAACMALYTREIVLAEAKEQS